MFVLKTSYARAAAISAVTGREYTTLMTDGCSYRPMVEDLGKVEDIEIGTAVDGTVTGRVKVNRIPSCVSGALIYGTTVGHFDHLAHLTPVQEIFPRDRYDTEKSFRFTLQMSNLYRVFGHDITWMRRIDNVELRPYANVNACVIDPYSLEEEPEEPYSMRDGTSFRREGRSVSLPNFDNIVDEPKVVVRVSKPVLTLCEWNRRDRPLPPAKFIKKTKTKVEFKIRAGATSNRAYLRSLPRPKQKEGFRNAQDIIAPMIPVAPDPERIIVPDTAATSNDA